MHLPREIPDILWHSRLTCSEKQEVLELLNQRIQQRIPAPYLTHEAWFAGLRFYVDQHVLIPRSPMAELIGQHFAPWVEPSKVRRVLDLCTGSGCIAIASALFAFPNADVDAVDISPESLKIAQQNIKDYGQEQRVHTVHSDLFSELAGMHYDLIVCNPPYVDPQVLQDMPKEYHYEPKIGLEAGEDGLFFVKKILREAAKHLMAKGVLIVEVGLSQANLIAQYPDVPFLWLEFQHGGEGVFLLTAEQLRKHLEIF